MAHVHDHHGGSDGAPVASVTTRRALLVAVAGFALAAALGLVLLWPDSDRPILAEELGLGAELVDAEVTLADVVPCANTDESQGILCQRVELDVTSGTPAGEEASFEVPVTEASVSFEPGDGLVLTFHPANEPGFQFFFYDFQRSSPMLLLAGLFVAAVVALGRWRGVRALVGLAVTGAVMVAFLFPSILDGHDPTAAALVSAVVIGLVALYLTHGVTERTTVALLGTFAALGLTAVLAAIFSSAAHFTGFGTEDAYYLQVASTRVDIPGLVLAGIVIGSLGVLDDVTVTQVSAIWQIHAANPGYGIGRLYRAGIEIGRDHIASTVNTLVLAYAGASLPLLLLFTQAGRGLTEVAQGELVAVEVVRTLVGSIGLVAAVPVTTGLAAWVVTRGSTTPGTAAAEREPPLPDAPAAPPEGPPSDPEAGWERFAPEDPQRW